MNFLLRDGKVTKTFAILYILAGIACDGISMAVDSERDVFVKTAGRSAGENGIIDFSVKNIDDSFTFVVGQYNIYVFICIDEAQFDRFAVRYACR